MDSSTFKFLKISFAASVLRGFDIVSDFALFIRVRLTKAGASSYHHDV